MKKLLLATIIILYATVALAGPPSAPPFVIGTDAIDAITEIAASLRSGDDATLITGTAGASGNCAQWNADNDLVDAGAACGASGNNIAAGDSSATVTDTGTGEIAFQIDDEGFKITDGGTNQVNFASPVNGVVTYDFDGTVVATAFQSDPTADPTWTFSDSTAAATGTGDIKVDAVTAAQPSKLRMYVDETGGDDVLYVTVDGENNEILFAKKIDLSEANIENAGSVALDSITADDGSSFTLQSDAITIGEAGDTDIALTFDANTADGVVTWMEDEDYFLFADDIHSTAGEITGGIYTISVAANCTIGTDCDSTSTRVAYGGVIYVTGAAVVTMPAVADGMSLSLITIGAIAVSLDPNASDKMYLDGTLLDDGDKATNTSTTGDSIVCTYYSADGWYCMSGSPDGDNWTDGGA